MEYFIRKVQINGLFDGDKNYTIELSDGCNCIFGSNGTGKTTVINLIVNAINVDVDSLVKVPFDSLVIYIAKVGQTRAKKFITVLRVLSDEPIDYGSPCQTIKYLFSGDNERLSYTLSPRAMERRSTVDKNNFLVSSIKKTVQEKIKLTHIPLLRMHDAELYSYREDRDGFLHMALRDRDFSNSEISEILDPSVRVLTALQNKFIQQANYNRKIITEKLESLKSKIIEKVMIDDVLVRQTTKALGKISRTIESGMESIDTELYISKLRDAGILVSDEKLHEHFNVWKRLNESIKTDHKNYLDVYSDSSSTEKKKVDAMQKYNTTYFSLFVMTHFHERFLSIVRDAEVTQFEKSCLTKPFRDYEDEINLYFGNKKEFTLSEDGHLHVTSGGREIKISDLSSGEKHILTILGRAALCGNSGTVFVADEPELSLHLDWQRMILPSIMKLSPKSQVIVATHSPAIYSKGLNEIDLEACVQ